MSLLKELLELENALCEAPYKITDALIAKVVKPLQDPRSNVKLYRKVMFMTKNRKMIETTNTGIELHRVVDGNETEIYGIDPQEKRIVYYVRFEIQKADFVNVPWATQVLVWSGTSPKAPKIPEYVFFKYVMAANGVVVTDKEQSGRGERFWKRTIEVAFTDIKYKIYIIDFNKKTVTRYKTLANFEKLYNTKNDPWGTEAYNYGIRPVITDIDIKEI